MRHESRLLFVKVLVLLGFSFTSFGLTLGLATYVVPNWYTYTVASSGSSWDQISRNRGIFQECSVITGLSVSIVLPYIIKYSCVDNDMGQYFDLGKLSDDKYIMIIRLRQSQYILHGISLIFALFILLIGIGVIIKWCKTYADTVFYIQWRLGLGLAALLIFFLMAASPALGTAIIYVESWNPPTTPYLPYIQSSNPNVIPSWAIMYILAWVSAGFYLLAALFFLISVCLGSKLEEQKYKPQILPIDNPSFTGEDDLNSTNKPIFLTPSMNTTFGQSYGNVTPNNTMSPGLLPRYTIS